MTVLISGGPRAPLAGNLTCDLINLYVGQSGAIAHPVVMQMKLPA